MRIIANISITRNKSTESIIDRLHELVPEEPKWSSAFDIFLDDPRYTECLRLLAQEGLRRWKWTPKSRQPGEREYSERHRRVYGEEDYHTAEFLQIRPLENMHGHDHRYEDGTIWLRLAELRGKKGLVDANWAVVFSDRIKKALEAASFQRIKFHPAVVATDELDARGGVPVLNHLPWWELRSDLILPPVSPFLVKRGHGDVPVPRDFTGMTYLQDPSGPGVELHYLRSDLDKAGPFDVALGFERFAGEHQRHTVVSNRFYRFCREHKIGCDWVPVRIDQG